MRSMQPEPLYLAVGRVARPHGVRGELRVELLTEFPERLATRERVYVGPEQRAYQVAEVRLHQRVALMRLVGCENRDAAEALRGALVYVAVEEAVPLEQDEYYEHQIEGLEVHTEEGQRLGEVVEVFTAPGANDVLVVHGPRGELLIPVIEDVIVAVDIEAGHIVIRVVPGLFGDA